MFFSTAELADWASGRLIAASPPAENYTPRYRGLTLIGVAGGT